MGSLSDAFDELVRRAFPTVAAAHKTTQVQATNTAKTRSASGAYAGGKLLGVALARNTAVAYGVYHPPQLVGSPLNAAQIATLEAMVAHPLPDEVNVFARPGPAKEYKNPPPIIGTPGLFEAYVYGK